MCHAAFVVAYPRSACSCLLYLVLTIHCYLLYKQLLPTVLPNTTHVIASKDGTDKILTARSIPGCFVVRVSWLMECYWSLRRRDEQPHLLRAMGTMRGTPLELPPPSLSNGITTTSSSGMEDGGTGVDEEGESEDDDFAAEFEKELM